MTDLSHVKFDLQAAAEKGAWMQVVNPVDGDDLVDQEGTPTRLLIKGADSMSYEEAAARTVALRSKPTNPKRKVTPQALLDASNKLAKSQSEELAAVTIGWEGVWWEGAKMECNQENAEKLYNEHRWLREQVMEFFGDRTNYQGNE